MVEHNPEFIVGRDTARILEQGVAGLPEDATLSFEGSRIQEITASAANLYGVHALGLWNSADPVIASAANAVNAQDTWRRYRESAYYIAAITTSESPRRAGTFIRTIHANLQGEDANGNVARALDPEHFGNAWTRIQWLYDMTAQRLGHDGEYRKRLLKEGIIQYQCIGVADTYVPKSLEEHFDRVHELIREAKRTILFERLIEGVEAPDFARDTALEPIVSAITNRVARFAVAAMPEQLRIQLDVPPPNLWESTVARMVDKASLVLARQAPAYMAQHPDVAVQSYGLPESLSDQAAFIAARRVLDLFAGEPSPTMRRQMITQSRL